MLKSYILGVLSSFFIAIVCVLLLTFVCVGGEDPREFMGLFGVISFLLGGVGGSFVAVLLSREGHMVVSLGTALTYALVVLTMSFYNRSDSSRPVWQTFLICFIMLGISFGMSVGFAKRTGGVKNTRKKLRKRIGRS